MKLTGEMMVVVDLDGTLCDSKHREHLALYKKWDEFHSLLKDDEPWPDVMTLLKVMDECQFYIIGLTGRNERYRTATLEWLDKYEIFLDVLLMRPDNDFRSDYELKPQMLRDRGITPKDVWFILEDRDKVVEAWRNEGFHCWQVRPGGY